MSAPIIIPLLGRMPALVSHDTKPTGSHRRSDAVPFAVDPFDREVSR